jgi:hypothetical protein
MMMRSLLHVALQVLARCQFNNLTKKKMKKKNSEDSRKQFGVALRFLGALLAPSHLAPSNPFGTLADPSVF